ncbi:N-ethylmaleimide reductase [Bosea sp. AK1]|nr:N-ethylmaleimide reductase [Bosea sp. AK1]
MTRHKALFKPVQLGTQTLRNRIVLPPLTRQRAAQPGDVATDLMAEYYRQRASAGFMISEGTQIEPRGQGYAWTPGIYTDPQIAGWRKVTDAVHAEGGVIFAQLWHVGRVSHTELQPNGDAPVAPSAIIAEKVKAFIEIEPGSGTLTAPSLPRELTVAEIGEIVELYAQAARNALAAGFDGVEIHSANGYLVNQFISEHANQRTDDYGGTLHNRLRFLREIVATVARVVGPDRLSVRFTSLFESTDQDRVYIGLVEQDPHATYIEAIKVLENAGVAYVSIAKRIGTMRPTCRQASAKRFGRPFRGASSTRDATPPSAPTAYCPLAWRTWSPLADLSSPTPTCQRGSPMAGRSTHCEPRRSMAERRRGSPTTPLIPTRLLPELALKKSRNL